VSFAAHVPLPPLRRFVAGAHGYRAPASPTGRHRGLPSRHLTLVLELRGPLQVAGLGAPVAAHGVVGGLHPSPALIVASVPQEGLQYALTPSAAQALLGVPAGELRGLTLDLAELFGAETDDLIDALRSTADWRRRFALVDAALLRRLGDTGIPDVPPELAEAWRFVHAKNGRVRVADVAAHVGWSRRHLGERFRGATGLTPKEAARIARFQATRDLLVSAPRPPLVDLAARCGYADQQHLAREWRQLAGCSVGTWLREELPFLHDSVPAELAG
jgi:AraC-like DNA-binding protein